MKLRKDLILRKIGDDYVIVDPGQEMVDMSTVFTLNSTSAFLWDELYEREFTLEVITDLLCTNYEVSMQIAQQDAKKIVAIFREYGLLVD